MYLSEILATQRVYYIVLLTYFSEILSNIEQMVPHLKSQVKETIQNGRIVSKFLSEFSTFYPKMPSKVC